MDVTSFRSKLWVGQRTDNPRFQGVRSAAVVLKQASAVREIELLCADDLDHFTLQTEVAATIRRAVDYDVAVQSTVDPASLLDTSCLPLGADRDPEREQRHFDLEYRREAPLSYREIARRPARAAALRLEIDDPRTVPRFVEIIAPSGGHDELRATFVADEQCWGSISLYRVLGRPEFSQEDVRFFTGVSEVIGRGLRGAFLRAATRHTPGVADPPGHMMMSRSGSLLSTTEAAERWLATLEQDDIVPAAITALVSALESQPAVRMTVVGTAGPLVIHGSTAKGFDDAVAVIIEKPRAIDLTPAIVTAHGLTERERQVTEGVLRGLVTKQIARGLGISEYTVQDHLKAIFAKVGVATRGELTYQLFMRHYLPPTLAGATPGPYGYYLDPPTGPGDGK
jgi:DNA-binding CsgD family transcriptional regulator